MNASAAHRRCVGGFLCFVCLALLLPPDAWGARRKNKKRSHRTRPVVVTNEDLTTVEVEVRLNRRRTRQYTLTCYNGEPGNVRTRGDRVLFISLSSNIKALRKRKRTRKKANTLKKVRRAGIEACAAAPEANPTPPDSSPPSDSPDGTPDPNPEETLPRDLQRYQGAFGAAEVRLLYDHFAFGASADEVAFGASAGLDGAVNRLLQRAATPGLDAQERDLRCDGVFGGSEVERGEDCDPENPQEVYFPGVRYGLYWRFMHSPNPFYEKLFMVLHDRIAASSIVLSSCQRLALVEHIEVLRTRAEDGNYRALLRDISTDHLMLDWLDGAHNREGSPNENFAREFWELFALGTTSPDGVPNYTPADVLEASRAFTGWTLESYEVQNPRILSGSNHVCLPAWVPAFHDPGAKVVFQNTPYARTVYSADDVLDATLAHPGAAYDLAEHLWLEYVNPQPTRETIEALAAIIRQDNFNIHRALGVMMRSNALFSDASRKSLLKDPVDFVFGFLRSTEIPMSMYELDKRLSAMGQRPTLPVTVFGWNPYQLAGEGYLIEARNALIAALRDTRYLEEQGFTFHVFLEDEMTSEEVVASLSALLSVPLNDRQKSHLDEFMNYEMQWDGTLDRESFDAHPDARHIWWEKTSNLLYLLASTYHYRLK